MPLTEVSNEQDLAVFARPDARDAGPVSISISCLSKIYPVPLARLKAFLRRQAKPPVEALRDVSFEVRRGEIFGLVGRNGAGKTTLTKIVATLVQPTSGSVTVNGYDSVRDDVRVRMQVGLANAEERSLRAKHSWLPVRGIGGEGGEDLQRQNHHASTHAAECRG